jgi:glycosyltransferase involved in cell wall biosynthesis
VNDLAVIGQSSFFPRSVVRFYKKHFQKFLDHSKATIALSELTKQAIIEKFPAYSSKIFVLDKYADENFQPVPEFIPASIKHIYTEDKEFFLYSGSMDKSKNLINLLKAFSFFKKRQKSNMQLLIMGTPDEEFKKELRSYKYRDEVKLVEDPPSYNQVQITASAYAMVCPVQVEQNTAHAMEAMQCAVPVISNTSPSLPASCIEACLQAKPTDINSIAEQMMVIFKDEKLRAEMIRKGSEAMRSYSKERTLSALAEILSPAKA